MSIGFAMDTAVSGLTASQRALEVTGHNVSNLGTAGYARQTVELAPYHTRSYGNWKVEMGVNIQEIRQIRNVFTDNMYRSETNALGYWDARSKAVKDIEAILGEPMTAGFQNSLNNFWDSWQELSKSPESLTTRALVKQRSESLVESVNHVNAQLTKLQSDLNDEIKTRIDAVNDITGQLAKLNVKIMSAEASSNSPNDYYDERSALIDKLSQLVKAETWVGQDGNVDVIVDGYFLVSKGVQTRIYAAPNQDLSHFYTPKVAGIDMPINLGQGEIEGLIEARGAVDGGKGSFDNGTPNTTADITIAIDMANTDVNYLNSIRTKISDLATDLNKRGINFNLRLVKIGGATVTNNDYGKNVASLQADMAAGITGTGSDFGDAVSSVTGSLPFTTDANRYLMVFAGQSIDGNGALTPDADVAAYADALKNGGFTVSVVTDPTYYNVGQSAAEKGWSAITGQTGGKLYDIGDLPDPADPAEVAAFSSYMTSLMKDVSKGVNDDVNMKISTIPADLNIISSVRKQLNALINIMAREVNYLHFSGTTLKGASAYVNSTNNIPFFEAVNPDIPMEMGNISINANLKDVNNIAASTIDANGDNTIALAIANLRNNNLMTGNKKVLSLDTYYQNIIMDIGNKGYEADNMVTSHTNLVNQSDSIRQATMGVSLDEEMTNMIKFKYAYNANSKMIDVVNTLLDTIIYRMGVSGR